MNKKEEKHSRIALTLLFAGLTFAILLLFIALVAIAVIIFVKTDIISIVSEVEINKALAIFLLILFSLVIGAGLSFLLSRILTGTINKVINTMNQLASGNYKARLETGSILNRHPTIVEITESFNKMATALDHTEIIHLDFINNFSHEFKTPIVSIAGFAKLLKHKDLTAEQQKEYIDIIEEESLRLANMATGVLELTKVESQTSSGTTKTYNLSEQIRSCVLLLEKQWAEKGLEPELIFDEYDITANEDMLRQVWLNLIDNAIKYSDDFGIFRITVSKNDENLAVRIMNSGTEISSEDLPFIFNKFYQADKSHASAGNGIGLALAKRIVSLHGGEITAESEKGKTVFTVILPAE